MKWSYLSQKSSRSNLRKSSFVKTDFSSASFLAFSSNSSFFARVPGRALWNILRKFLIDMMNKQNKHETLTFSKSGLFFFESLESDIGLLNAINFLIFSSTVWFCVWMVRRTLTFVVFSWPFFLTLSFVGLSINIIQKFRDWSMLSKFKGYKIGQVNNWLNLISINETFKVPSTICKLRLRIFVDILIYTWESFEFRYWMFIVLWFQKRFFFL